MQIIQRANFCDIIIDNWFFDSQAHDICESSQISEIASRTAELAEVIFWTYDIDYWKLMVILCSIKPGWSWPLR